MVLNKKSNITRLSSLDILRGLAVIFMVEAHIAIVLPFFTELAGIFAAPAFVFVAGVSFQLLLRNRETKGMNTPDTFLEVFWRAATLFLMTSAITWTADLVLGLGSSVFTNIFVIISTGFIVGFLVRKSLKGKILAIISVLVINFLIRFYQIQALAFLTGDLYQDVIYISVLPFVSFFIFGQIAYEAYKSNNYNIKDNNFLLVYAALFFLLNLALYLAFPYPFNMQGRDYTPELLMMASIFILVTFLTVRVVDLQGKLRFWLRPLENMGKISFTGYYISYISFIVLGTIQFQQPVQASVLIFLVTSAGLVVLERLWRPQYRYGFEWFYRKISARALDFTKKIIS